MNTQNTPIITSLLDADLYKFTMGQLAWRKFRDVPVRYAFTNRTAAVRLAEYVDVDELRAQIRQTQALSLRDDERRYLLENEHVCHLFDPDYVAFLSSLRLPDVSVETHDGQFRIEVEGSWPEAILWETLLLSIVNELYTRALTAAISEEEREALHEEGCRRLREKIEKLRHYPNIVFSDFGTRRRYGAAWQREVVAECARLLPRQFAGTSNVLLAKELGLKPIGTFAHEMYMVLSGIYRSSEKDIRASHARVWEYWYDEFGPELSIALTDTYGTPAFFSDFVEHAERWHGLRHDSGDPIAFGEQAIAFYRNNGIDPKQKLIVFSDGLDADTIIRLHRHFSGRIKTAFGWGTNLTNDLGLQPLSIVIKAVESCGHGTVKLSDNLAKAIGAPEDIALFMKIFDYVSGDFEYEACIY